MPDTKEVRELLTQIDHGEMLLPEIQRGYVWRRDQVLYNQNRWGGR